MTAIAVDSPVVSSHVPRGEWLRPGVAVFCLGVLTLLSQGLFGADEWWAPGLVTIASGVPLLAGLLRALRRDSREVLADHLLVLVGSYIVYFVVGALLIPFGPKEQAERALLYYWLDAPLALRVTAVNCIGLGLALVSGSLLKRDRVASIARSALRSGRLVSRNQAVVIFLLLGGASSLYVLTYDLGQRPDEVAPGVMRVLSSLLLVVIMIASAQRSWRWAGLALALTLVQAVIGLALLSKAGVLLPLLALMGGLAWRLGVRKVLVLGVPVLFGIFVLIADPITRARNVYGVSIYGDNEWIQVDLLERLAVLPKAVSQAGNLLAEADYNSWARFCYLPAQAAGLNFYDAGDGSEDYRLLGWSLLPRFIFPEKPIMTAASGELNTKITGSVGSNTGQGVFTDGYYNLGWLGVILFSVAVGCILACTSAFAAEVLRADALLWLPLALLGTLMAFRIDGSFLVDYWGMFVLFVYVVFAGVAIQKLLFRLSPPK